MYTKRVQVIILLLFTVVACKNNGISPKHEVEFEITNVEVNPNPVFSGDSVEFLAITSDSLETGYGLKWVLSLAENIEIDTFTTSTKIVINAPIDTGEYKYKVSVESEKGERLSNSFEFSLSVERFTDPFYENAKLLFSSSEGIFLMDVDNNEIRFLIEGSSPRWSPDGEKIAFIALSEGWNVFNVYIMNKDGSDMRAISLMEQNGELEPHLGTSGYPVWSPDGKRIAYSRCDNCEVGGLNYEVFNVAIDTSSGLDEVKVTENNFGDYIYDWHFETNKILFESDENIDGSYNGEGYFYKIDPDGSNKTLFFKADSISLPRFSPDGERVAFVFNQEIYISDLDGNNKQRITGNDKTKCSLSWGYDANRLIFIQSEDNCQSLEKNILSIKIDGTDLRPILNQVDDYLNVDWQSIKN